MKSRIIYFLFLLVGTFSAKSQTWAPLGSGITGTDVNTTWALCTYDSVLFAGGWFDNAGGIAVNDMAQWNGTNWEPTSTGSSGFINAMAIYNGHLYVGGQFDSIGGIAASNIAMWNGSQWMSVGGGIKTSDFGVYALAVYDGILYAGGGFDSAGAKAIFALAQWNGANWSGVGSGLSSADEDDAVFALAVYKGALYIAGDFVITGSTNIAQWNGSILSGVGGGTVGEIYTLAVYKNNLYAGGMISMAGVLQANCIAMWNNATWATLDSGITGENGWASINALTVYNDELYAGGFFDTVNGANMNCIAKWNDIKWSSVGSGINVGGSIDAMEVFNNSLYIGGGFDSAGGVYAKNIAMLTESTGINKLNTTNEILAYPNPANNIISIATGHFNQGMSYTIYNELGQQITTGKLDASNTTRVDVSNYTNGIYLISVSDGNRQNITKFIKN